MFLLYATWKRYDDFNTALENDYWEQKVLFSLLQVIPLLQYLRWNKKKNGTRNFLFFIDNLVLSQFFFLCRVASIEYSKVSWYLSFGMTMKVTFTFTSCETACHSIAVLNRSNGSSKSYPHASYFLHRNHTSHTM